MCFRVVHRDAFAVNATAAELLRHRLRRDRRRAARISKAAAGGAAANGTRTGGGGVTAAVRGLHRRRSVNFAAPALPTRRRCWSPEVCPVSPEVR